MPTVKYSVSAYIADGTTTDYLITWAYLDDDHITVEIDGLSNADPTASHTFTKLNNTTVRVTDGIGGAIAAGKEIQLRRSTPITTRPISFADGSALLAADLNKNSDYLLFSMQEALDQVDFSVQYQKQAEGFRDATQTLQLAASASQVAAAASQVAAAASEAASATDAATVASNLAAAAASETAAELAETNAETAQSAAETAAALATTNGAAQVTLATTQAALATTNGAAQVTLATTQAALATTNGAAQVTLATTQAALATTNGAAQVTLATTQATNSATSASESASSAAASLASSTASNGKAVEALASANNAASSASSASSSATTSSNASSAASTSASNASTSETNAATSETNAASSATNAVSSATAAATSETNAATSETNAATSETNAATSATAAASSASAASTSATSASNAQTAAESARDATLAAYDNFDDRYLGAKSSTPTVDNDGNALVAGSLYFDTVSGSMKVYTGSSWVAAYVSGTDYLPFSGGTMTGDVAYGDGVKATFGSSADLQVYHDSNNSYISEQGQGVLYIQGSNNVQIESATGENMAVFLADNAVELYHDNSKKLETSSTGSTVYGSLLAYTPSSNDWALRGYNSSNSALSGLWYSNDSAQFIGRNSSNALTVNINSSGSSYLNGGNVGIGTTSPSTKLDVAGDAAITNSGHILVGKTSRDSTNTVGAELKDTGEVIATVDGAIASYLNRKTSDGDIIQFRKDNIAVGSIGSTSGGLYVDFGNWTITESGGSLYFATGGTNKMKLDASGNLDVVGNVNSNATIT